MKKETAKPNSIKRNKGFSLVEVLVAIGILAILSMGLATMMTNMSKSNAFLSTKQEYLALNNLLLQYMASDKCKYILQSGAADAGNMFSGMSGTPSYAFNSWGGGIINLNHITTNPVTAAEPNPPDLITTGLPISPGSKLMINSIQVEKMAADGLPSNITITSGASNNQHVAAGSHPYQRGTLTLRVVPMIVSANINEATGSIRPLDIKFEGVTQIDGANQMWLCGTSIDTVLNNPALATVSNTTCGGLPVGSTRTAYSTNVSTNCAGVSTTQTCMNTGAWSPGGYPYTSCAPPTTSTTSTATTTRLSTACSKTCSTSKTSDVRVKKDIHDFGLGLKEILGIRPVYYKYNGLGETPVDTEDRVGVIAQEVLPVAPELVGKQNVWMQPSDQTKTQIHNVDYEAFTFMLINSVKELNQKQKELEQSISQLKKQNKELRHIVCEKNTKANECR